jgi:hypothetical protein
MKTLNTQASKNRQSRNRLTKDEKKESLARRNLRKDKQKWHLTAA